MKLEPIQLSILLTQITALLLNFYAIFIKRVPDNGAHIVAICLVSLMICLSVKSWIDCNKKSL